MLCTASVSEVSLYWLCFIITSMHGLQHNFHPEPLVNLKNEITKVFTDLIVTSAKYKSLIIHYAIVRVLVSNRMFALIKQSLHCNTVGRFAITHSTHFININLHSHRTIQTHWCLYNEPVYHGHLGTNHKFPDYQGVLIIKVS